MEPSPESPDNAVESESTLLRFKRLTTRLFGVNRDEFQEALKLDEAERAKRRALGRVAPRGKPPPDNLP